MTQAVASLAFNGNCADAMRFHEEALGGALEVMMSGASWPMAEKTPKEVADRILRARLVLPGGGRHWVGQKTPVRRTSPSVSAIEWLETGV